MVFLPFQPIWSPVNGADISLFETVLSETLIYFWIFMSQSPCSLGFSQELAEGYKVLAMERSLLHSVTNCNLVMLHLYLLIIIVGLY